MMGLIVTNQDGQRIGFGRANARFFSHILTHCLNTFLFVGYLVMFFTPKKQTLHDLIAKTVVLDTRASDGPKMVGADGLEPPTSSL
ncbi:MAG: RDD family protein [Candidatus Melainabacteria bacterium]